MLSYHQMPLNLTCWAFKFIMKLHKGECTSQNRAALFCFQLTSVCFQPLFLFYILLLYSAPPLYIYTHSLINTRVCFHTGLASPLMALNAIHVSHRHAGKWTNQSLNSLFIHTLPVYNSFKLFTSSSCSALFTLQLDCTCPLMHVRSLEGLLLFLSVVNVFPIKTQSHCSFRDSQCWWKVM